MISVAAEHIEISYADRSGKRVLLRDFSTEVRPGELLAVIGANGTGKSSLLRVLAGIQRPQRGEVRWNGRPVDDIRRSERPRLAGALFSRFARVPGLTVGELVALGRQPYAGPFGSLDALDRERIEYALERTGIIHLMDRPVFRLSDGEFQKSLLAKLLAQDTPILFLDEPATHLDVPATIEFLGLIKSLAAEFDKSVVLTSHELALVFQWTPRILLLGGDGNYVEGSPRQVSEHALMCDFLKTDHVRFEEGRFVVDFGEGDWKSDTSKKEHGDPRSGDR